MRMVDSQSGAKCRPISTLGTLIIAAAWIVAAAPFLNKAYHIDDVLYLRVADQILRSPFDPYNGMVLWDAPDGQPGNLFDTDYNPPLWKYILAGTIATFGREEWKLHAVEAIFALGAAFGVCRVARRFTEHAVWCSVLLLWSPFFLPGWNIMLEGPLLCFCAWAIEFTLRAIETESPRDILVAGGLLAAAVVTKYTAGLLLPILGLACILCRKPKALAALSFPIAALGIWMLHNRFVYGHIHFGSHGFHFGGDEIWTRCRAVVLCIGAVAPLGPLLAAGLWGRGKPGRLAVAACLAAGCAFAWAELRWLKFGVNYGQGWSPTALQECHYAVFAFHGCFQLAALTALTALSWRQGRWRSGPLGAFWIPELMILGYLAFNVLSVPFNAVRHLLLAIVPMLWLTARHVDGIADWPRLRAATLTVSSLLGFGLAAADFEIAGCYRTAANEIVARWAHGSNVVWFSGNWGFVHYANQAGGYPLVQQPAAYGLPNPKAGDIIVHPRLLTWRYLSLPSELAAVTSLEHHMPPSTSPFRTIAPGVHYYSLVGETLPWEILIFGTDADEKKAWFQLPPLDDILVYRIERKP